MKLYLVGGTVRRYMLGLPPTKDLDFAVEAESYEAMKEELVTNYGLTIWQEREKFVTLRGRLPITHVNWFAGVLRGYSGVVDADFTLCRKEAMYSDGRHPDTVTPTHLWEDLSRRDFTVNAVAISEAGEWIDPYGGKRDAVDRILRAVGDAGERLEEDPLRGLRALRFMVTEGFTAAPALDAALNFYVNLSGLPVERVQNELLRAFQTNAYQTMTLLVLKYRNILQQMQTLYPDLWFKPTTEKR